MFLRAFTLFWQAFAVCHQWASGSGECLVNGLWKCHPVLDDGEIRDLVMMALHDSCWWKFSGRCFLSLVLTLISSLLWYHRLLREAMKEIALNSAKHSWARDFSRTASCRLAFILFIYLFVYLLYEKLVILEISFQRKFSIWKPSWKNVSIFCVVI